ncbi:VWA-like domain-containing protein [Rhodopirellula sp. JC740]|uniref:VWA-like domain-containing protein n=1 Tax=Rhodopirellula halodulae TaxID=2894198 RepID=A0ABS8NKL8_9BACT|nr:VWA-like domain-containing protein [Rhodopirellula sp. JC740]MCC9644112.1 VWA-like domain-containing protein [Rhodopirellula sp. JC740]
MSSKAAIQSKANPRESKARERITRVVEGWYLVDPLLFAAWTLHEVIAKPEVATIRVAHGRVEFNPEFVRSLKQDELAEVLRFEAMRILLGHPYARRQPKAELSYAASNLTVQECLRSKLPMPRPRETFGDESHDHQYFEYYYRQLVQRESDEEPERDDQKPSESDSDESGVSEAQAGPSSDSSDAEEDDSAGSDVIDGGAEAGESDQGEDSSGEGSSAATGPDDSPAKEDDSDAAGDQPTRNDLEAYIDPAQTGTQNADQWDSDDLLHEEIKATVAEAAENGGWGTLPGYAQEQLRATLRPPLDYRAVLRQFRQSVLSVDRKLTRMRPSRRYGFAQMGSRYDFTTSLLFAVDVSGSMSRRDLENGFSIVNRFFQYGIRSVDVIWFDTEVRCQPMTFRAARRDVQVTGRGGTDLNCVTVFLNEHRSYDGMVVFTDGDSPVPRKSSNTRTRVLWLFNTQAAFRRSASALRPIGKTAFLKPSRMIGPSSR